MFTEKLIKPLSSALIEAGITSPLPLQEKSISKLNAGQDMFGVGPKGIGKTTTAIITTIQKLKEEFEDAPRALIIVATHEKALEMKDRFRVLGKNTSLRYACAIEGIKIEKQFEEIYIGTDVIIGTTKRIMDIYFKHGLNLNKLKLFILDDAESQIKDAQQGNVDRLIQSLPKCQHLVFVNELNPKIEKLTSKLMVNPFIVEITQ
jgi:superfamily II DNA/RNA helicase